MQDREPTVRSRELGHGLREAMLAARLNGKELAEQLGWAQSRVSKLLAGKRTVREVDIAAFLAVCGVTGETRERLLRMRREDAETTTLHQRGARLPTYLGRYPEYEADAARLTEFSCVQFPALLRTGGYSRAWLNASVTVPATGVDGAMAAILTRSGALGVPRPPDCLFLIHEWVLRTPVGSPAVMAEQLHHVVRMSVWPNIAVRVVPISAGAHAAGTGSFTLLEFTEFRSLVHREEEHSDVFLEEESEVDDYRHIVGRLADIAWDQTESRNVIAGLAAQVRQLVDDGRDPVWSASAGFFREDSHERAGS